MENDQISNKKDSINEDKLRIMRNRAKTEVVCDEKQHNSELEQIEERKH
jgi:protein involved in polysaccharide export with SLBB domain